MSHTPHAEILVVDDNEDIRWFVSAALRSCGFTVHTASNGHEGLEVLQRERIDLVVSDVDMPGCNGTDFFLKASVLPKRTPFVFFTASDTSHLRAMLGDSVEVVSKDVSFQEFQRRIHELVLSAKRVA